MMQHLSPLVAPQVVVTTTCGANSDGKVGIMTMFDCVYISERPRLSDWPTKLIIWSQQNKAQQNLMYILWDILQVMYAFRNKHSMAYMQNWSYPTVTLHPVIYKGDANCFLEGSLQDEHPRIYIGSIGR